MTTIRRPLLPGSNYRTGDQLGEDMIPAVDPVPEYPLGEEPCVEVDWDCSIDWYRWKAAGEPPDAENATESPSARLPWRSI